MENTSAAKSWALANLAGTVIALTFNGLANGLPLNGYNTGQISQFYPNLFVPAGLTFSIWGLIYLLMIGFTIHGLVAAFKKNENTMVKFVHVGPWYLISCLANASWILAWHYLQITASLIIMLILLFSLIQIYERLEKDPFPRTFPEKLTLRWPFSVYLGWITIATVANATAWLVAADWNGFGLSDDFWLSTVIVTAVVISAAFIIRKKDSAYGWVIVWALAGIVLKRNQAGDSGLTGYYLALGGIVMIAFLSGIMAFRKTKPRVI